MRKWFAAALVLGGALNAADSSPPPTYDADLFKKDRKAIFTNLEALYWATEESGLDYALKMKGPAWGPSNVFASGRYQRANFGWDPGFRLSVGYFNAPHYWDAYLQYTYFVNQGHSEAHKPHPANQFLTGTWPQPDPNSTTPALTKATSDVALHYHLIDLIATRRFHPNPHFRMRLFAGMSMAWLKQFWKIHYVDNSGHKSNIRNHWRFTGPGIKTGLTLDWYLGRADIYLTGTATGGFFGGYYRNVSKQTTTFTATGFDSSIPIRNAHYRDVRVAGLAQISAGPSWQKAFAKMRTEIFLGYEVNLWMNLHEVFRSSSGTPQAPKETWKDQSAIALQGFTLRWNLDF
jgi:hypothetical protein